MNVIQQPQNLSRPPVDWMSLHILRGHWLFMGHRRLQTADYQGCAINLQMIGDQDLHTHLLSNLSFPQHSKFWRRFLVVDSRKD